MGDHTNQYPTVCTARSSVAIISGITVKDGACSYTVNLCKRLEINPRFKTSIQALYYFFNTPCCSFSALGNKRLHFIFPNQIIYEIITAVKH